MVIPESPVDFANVHIVSRGDTLWSIAESRLGAGHRWPEIAEVNGIIDPARLRVGFELTIPQN